MQRKRLAVGGMVLAFVALVAWIGGTRAAVADPDVQDTILSAVRAELQHEPWEIESITLGESQVESRGIMRLTRQPFTATLRIPEPRFRAVEQTDTHLFLEQVTDPEHPMAFAGEARLLTGPGVNEIEIAFADTRTLYDPGLTIDRFPIRDRIVLMDGTPEADEARAQRAAEQQAAAARVAAEQQAELERIATVYGGS